MDSSDYSGVYQGMRVYLNSERLLICAFVDFENVLSLETYQVSAHARVSAHLQTFARLIAAGGWAIT